MFFLKTNCGWKVIPFPIAKRWIMRISFFITTIFCLQMAAFAYSQKKVSIYVKKESLGKVLTQIEQNSDYRFLYSDHPVFDKSSITLSVNDAGIDELMQKLLAGTGLTYRVNNKDLVIIVEAGAENRLSPITGVIKNEKGEPLPGVSVFVKGTSKGTTSNNSGEFTIDANKGDKLVFSYVGMETLELTIGDKAQLTVVLKPSLSLQDEIVVVGYGTLNNKEISSAITHVSAKDLLVQGANSPLMALQGKVAGLSITNTAAADPNSTPSIQLRGVSSRDAGLGPLFVINGIPGGNLDNINQNDIESMDILKGGAASAIYGTRGSNGVIVITTKKGSSEPRIFYDGYISFDYATNKLKVLSREEFLAHDRGVDFGGNTDWLKEVSRNPSFAQKHTIQVSGGSAKTNYMASADYRKAEGIDLRASKEEYGARLNINHRSANGLIEVGINVAPRYAHTNLADYSGFNYALNLNPTMSIFDSTGKYAYINTGFFANNPVEQAKKVLDEQEIKYLDINGSIKVNLLKNLNTVVTVGQVSSSFRNKDFTPSTMSYILPVNGGTGRNTASQSLNENDQKSFEWMGNYSLNLSKHSVKLLAGYSFQQFTSSGFNASNEQFPSDVLTYNNLGTGLWNLEQGRLGLGSYKNSSRLIAFFGRLNYDFNEKYYLSASLRREGSSKFGYHNKWGNFPAVSLAWRMEREPFLQNISWLNQLKLRADYGETGNQDFGNYLSLDTYSGYGYYVFNGVTYQVWGPSQNTNYDLRWEKAQNFNFGIDFDVLKGKLTGSLNYYIRRNKDLLGWYDVPNPPNIQQQTYANVGTMKNSGVEIQLKAAAVQTRNFSYTVTFAAATNDNKFVSFSNDLFKGQQYVDVVSMPAPGSPGTIQRLQENKRIGSFYLMRSAGVDDNGALLVYDKKGDVIVANTAKNDDKQFIGNGLPQFTASLSNNFTYKNWDLSIFLRSALGYDVFNTVAFYMGTPATQKNANLLNSAFDGSKYSKLTNPSTYSVLSDYFLEPGGFVKVANVSIGYTKPLQLKYLKSVRLYATGRNLHTFTKFTAGDPELIQVNGLYPGVRNTLSYYPATLQVLLGLQLHF
jgi:TonB-linked outer membrane protein, SusC/RagA family